MRKKYCESLVIPTVAGPFISLSTLTNEKAPLIMPNPSPLTFNIIVRINLSKFNTEIG
jgi:hypothetical protein